MDYKRTIRATANGGYENLAGLIVLSLGITLTLAPLAAAGAVGTPLAVLGGLWATCLLLGIGVVAAARYTMAVATRGVAVDLWPSIVPTLKDPVLGLEVGAVTFGVSIAAVLAPLLAPSAYRSVAIGIGAFLLVLWYLLAAFATPELGTGRGLGTALRAGGSRLVESPGSAVVFLVLTVVCTLATGITVVTMGLFLPGLLSLLAAQLATAVNGDADRTDSGVG